MFMSLVEIINEFSKYKNDGIHYKNLCEELLKYFKVQKRCVREEVTSQGQKFKTYEWNNIVNALYTTFESKKIKRLCYLEKDNDENKKKDVLNIHEEFRNFCIEKKARLRNISDMNFEQCNDYMSWITEKKRGLQAIDPNYENIREYKEYFDIHHNCNYPWLVSNTPDVTCSQITRSRGKEKEGASKSAGDSSQTAPPTIPDSTINAKKDIPLSPTDSFKGELVPASNKYPNISPEIAPKKIGSPPDDANTVKDNHLIYSLMVDQYKYRIYKLIPLQLIHILGVLYHFQVLRYFLHRIHVANDFHHQIFMYSHIKQEFHQWKNILQKLNLGELLLHSLIMNFLHSLQVLQV
ncbi:hypothetical protein POVWA1_080240 [Plasmodium ovale wallikeri]|uniref:STP1 protein n=1 Tax=Plasmodium ovale wallikeri TaxID=864142 RepID=A0A1A9ALM8_PLAOA|nr:hypothetical protein POVWA1_080240 [Plasmodium ovale wallikeri]